MKCAMAPALIKSFLKKTNQDRAARTRMYLKFFFKIFFLFQ